jgi:beta-glucosidase
VVQTQRKTGCFFIPPATSNFIARVYTWRNRVLQRALERLELPDAKVSRAVLRGRGVGTNILLPDKMALRMCRELQDVYLQACRGDDFIGVQTYTRRRFDSTGILEPEKEAQLTQMVWEDYPMALEATIRQASNVTGKPVFVTENGIATADDAQRIAYIKEALLGVAACLRDGVIIQGYTYWSGLDNFEWRAGYGPTFGLVAVDRKTQQRTVKPSGHWLGAVARNGGF